MATTASGPSGAERAISVPADFAEELDRAGLIFNAEVFSGFAVARVLPNPHFEYSFAVKHDSLPFEVRFSTRKAPLADRLDPQMLLDRYVWASIANMARKEKGEPFMAGPKPFPPDAVRAEFGADWGVTSRIAPEPTFAKYDAGLVNVIYLRETSVLGYVVYLFDDKEPGKPGDETTDALRQVFHCIAFRRQ